MSAGFYNQEEQFGKLTAGFGFTIAISVFLHIVFIAFIFLLANDSSSIRIATPIYTVDLIAPEKPREAMAEDETLKVAPSAGAWIETKKDVSMPAVKERAIVLKKEKEPSLDEAIKKIQQRVKKREAEETISKTMQDLENRHLEKRIKEIGEKVAHRQVIMPIKKDTGLVQTGGRIKKIEEIEENYGSLLWEIIGSKWNYTGDIKQGEFVVITVLIDKTGHLVKSYVEQPSANPILLQSAIRAIEKAAPSFPSFPPELEKDSLEIGVCFPECRK